MNSDQATSQNIPFAPEVEEACLGALLTNPLAYSSIAQHIGKDDFFLLRHQYIWEAVSRIIGRGLDFDYLTVGQELDDMGHLDEVGSVPYLMRLINNTPTSVHGELYALIIKSESTRRRMLNAAEEIKGLALNGELPLEKVREEAQTRLQNAIGKSLTRRTHTMNDLLLALLNEVEARMSQRDSGQPMYGISTGWAALDEITYGWLPGQFWLVGGRPGSGKTVFLVNALINAARQGKQVWAWLGEQDALEIMRRVMVREAKRSGIQIRDMLNGTVSADQYAEMLNAVPSLSGLKIIMDDTPGISLAEMKAETMALKMRGKLDLVVIDRIELMSVPGLDQKGHETARITALSTGLKGLARTLDVPVISAVQLSRAVEQRENKRPRLSDMRDSGSLEQDADGVLFLYRDAYYNPDTTDAPNLMEVNLAKHRDGDLGTVGLYFDKPAMDLIEGRFEHVDLADRVQFNGAQSHAHHAANDND